MPLGLAGANVLLVPGHGCLGGGGGGSGGGGGLGGFCSSFSALVRVAAVDLMSLVLSPDLRLACCCCAILFVPAPGSGLRGSGGGGLDGGRGLSGWRTLSSSSGVVNLPAMVLLLVWVFVVIFYGAKSGVTAVADRFPWSGGVC